VGEDGDIGAGIQRRTGQNIEFMAFQANQGNPANSNDENPTSGRGNGRR
jgi:hypothetical protein